MEEPADGVREFDVGPVPRTGAVGLRAPGVPGDADTPQHTYQVLTKRARRLRQVADRLEWPAYPSRYTTRPSRDPVMPPNCGMYRPSRLCTTLAREALTAASEE
jgi:hypothetical protein